ncbi:MAG: hypothetical protein ABI959_01020 [Candidatus Dormiibacterota bacterium]
MRLGSIDRAVLDALLPERSSTVLPMGLMDTGFDDFLLDFEREAPDAFRRVFRLALFAGGWMAPVLIGRPPPITGLNQDDREKALAAMARSRVPELRQLITVLKTVASLHYGALPEVRKAIGYHGE